jgi:3-oxoacyl-[acyl-carrier-protein] synthase-3
MPDARAHVVEQTAHAPPPTAPTAVVCGVGGYVPPLVVPNEQVCRRLDVTEEWIRTRTGIHRRHRVEPGTATSDLAVAAGRTALASAGMRSVDAVVLATSTPDQHCPATAPTVAHRLGLVAAAAVDVGAVCSGFVYALATGAGLVAAGIAGSVLVIGADTFSTIVHPDDRDSGAVFGDGAGAVVLRRGTAREPGALLAFDLGSDGGGAHLIGITAGGSRVPRPPGPGFGRSGNGTGARPGEREHWFAMAGRVVYRQSVAQLAGSCRRVLAAVGWDVAEVDHVVLHQANRRIIDAVGRELGIGPQHVLSNIDQVANTAAASIPLLLGQAEADGRLRAGDRVVLAAFGGGLAWGGAALVWPGG